MACSTVLEPVVFSVTSIDTTYFGPTSATEGSIELFSNKVLLDDFLLQDSSDATEAEI